MGPAELGARSPAGHEGEWTLRQVVHHVANVTYYAEAMGRLVTPPAGG